MMRMRVEMKDDLDEIELLLPNGIVMNIQMSDIDADSAPVLDIAFNQPICTTSYMDQLIPSTCVGDKENVLKCFQIFIPLEGEHEQTSN